MQTKQNKIPPSGDLRMILAAEGDPVSRGLLESVLGAEYQVLFAETGPSALELGREYGRRISLVLLDLAVPGLPGQELLKKIQSEDALGSAPVVVVAADPGEAAECLRLGAADFLLKPLSEPGVILSRIRGAIELSEGRETISLTERDPVTGLYTQEYFFRYVQQLDQRRPEAEMDAVAVDVERFHMINERFGPAFGDGVLRRVGEKLAETVSPEGGILCRREADTFLIYCPHGTDYAAILENASFGLAEGESVNYRVRPRMGVYPSADKALSPELRFRRALTAADSVKGNHLKSIGFYDEALKEKQRQDEALVRQFPKALKESRFKVHFQPKYDIRSSRPRLASAEALVRWDHPELGLLLPGAFIPLLEENGLIQALDTYVLRETARQIRAWRDSCGVSVPVSVNLSRIDLFDPDLGAKLQAILREFGLSEDDLMLEITESAYARASEQSLQNAHGLRKLGFRIEMDNFGSGCSSLSAISSLPIDVLKLDRHCTRAAFGETRDIRMLELFIDIADYLSVPVVAEGVETQEQLDALNRLGCDLAQGYFFSKPLPPEAFEELLREAQTAAVREAPPAEDVEEPEAEEPEMEEPEAKEHISFFEKALLSEVSPMQQSASDPSHEVPPPRRGKAALQLKSTSFLFIIFALLAAVALLLSDLAVSRGYRSMNAASSRFIQSQAAAANMESGSDYLTDRVRSFVFTGETAYMDDYCEEVEFARRREKALSDLKKLMDGNDDEAYANLSTAMELSTELEQRERLAMRLVLAAKNVPEEEYPELLKGVEVSGEYLSMSPDDQMEKARTLVFDNTYMRYKARIWESVKLCTQELILNSNLELEKASSIMSMYLSLQTLLTIVFLGIVLLLVIFISRQVRKPLTSMVELMGTRQSVPPAGAEELQYVAETYNTLLQENQRVQERLRHAASHDQLTGLFNRGAYEMMLKSVDTSHMALILVDIDYFKKVNDNYGFDVGDKVLKRVAEILKRSFRSVDVVCRIGGDEFVVIMTRADNSMRDVVITKIRRANEMLRNPKDDLPPVSLSVGAAFSDRKRPHGDIFKDADTALYRVKEGGRAGCQVY